MTMFVPAAIYLAMNILGFLSLQYIDAATFAIIAQVGPPPSRGPRPRLAPSEFHRFVSFSLSQMKIFTTAIFSVLILQRRLHLRKWRALLTLTLGVVLISHEAMPKVSQTTTSGPKTKPRRGIVYFLWKWGSSSAYQTQMPQRHVSVASRPSCGNWGETWSPPGLGRAAQETRGRPSMKRTC